MRKFLFLFVISFLIFNFSYAQNLTGGVSNFTDCLKMLDLTPEQSNKIQIIQKEEAAVLKPLSLNYASKQRGVELLENMKCKTFDFNCKNLLREDLELRKRERREALYKIQQKQDYYKIRYRNILTRQQDIKLQELLSEKAHIQKVLQEREERAKKEKKFFKKSKT